MRPRLGRWTKASALLLFGLVCSLVFGEIILAILMPQLYSRPSVWQYDRRLGWSHIPDSDGQLRTPEFDVEYRINGRGLRDPDFGLSSRGRCLLLFGDSFAEGWGVSIDQVLSERLQADIAAHQIPNQVYNFGVAGYGTDQQLLMFQGLGRSYSPDIVIVLFYGNDLWNNSLSRGIGMERGYKPRFVIGPNGNLQLNGVPVRRSHHWDRAGQDHPATQRVLRYLYEHWHLAVLVSKALADEVPKSQQRDFYKALYGVGPDSERFDTMWTITDRIFSEFDRQVRAAGARLLVVYAPSIVQIEPSDWRAKKQLHGLLEQYDLEKPNRRLAGIAASRSIDFLDLSEVFHQAAVTRTLYYRDSHWNAAGHSVAAAHIGKYLFEGAWLE